MRPPAVRNTFAGRRAVGRHTAPGDLCALLEKQYTETLEGQRSTDGGATHPSADDDGVPVRRLDGGVHAAGRSRAGDHECQSRDIASRVNPAA